MGTMVALSRSPLATGCSKFCSLWSPVLPHEAERTIMLNLLVRLHRALLAPSRPYL